MKRVRHPRGIAAGKTLHIEVTSELFHDIESTKDKMDGKCRSRFRKKFKSQGIEKMLNLFYLM